MEIERSWSYLSVTVSLPWQCGSWKQVSFISSIWFMRKYLPTGKQVRISDGNGIPWQNSPTKSLLFYANELDGLTLLAFLSGLSSLLVLYWNCPAPSSYFFLTNHIIKIVELGDNAYLCIYLQCIVFDNLNAKGLRWFPPQPFSVISLAICLTCRSQICWRFVNHSHLHFDFKLFTLLRFIFQYLNSLFGDLLFLFHFYGLTGW